MKVKNLIAALLASVSVAAFAADATLNSEDGSTSITVHTAGMEHFINKHGARQIHFYASYRTGARVLRGWHAVTGCGKEGGKIAEMDEATGKFDSVDTWIDTGGSMRDGMAITACALAYNKFNLRGKL